MRKAENLKETKDMVEGEGWEQSGDYHPIAVLISKNIIWTINHFPVLSSHCSTYSFTCSTNSYLG